MSGIASTIKLGRPRAEISFSAATGTPDGLDIQMNNVASRLENALGEIFVRTRRRRRPRFAFRLPKVAEALASQLEGLRSITDTHLALIWANARPVYSDRIAIDDTTHLTLPSTPETLLGKAYKDAGGGHNDIINVTGVFAAYDVAGAQETTNFWTGGSYDSQTRIVTLGSSPGAAGTIVYVNWTYTGALVALANGSPRKHQAGGEVDLWDISLDLEGV